MLSKTPWWKRLACGKYHLSRIQIEKNCVRLLHHAWLGDRPADQGHTGLMAWAMEWRMSMEGSCCAPRNISRYRGLQRQKSSSSLCLTGTWPMLSKSEVRQSSQKTTWQPHQDLSARNTLPVYDRASSARPRTSIKCAGMAANSCPLCDPFAISYSETGS